ncbi:YppE family protein [Bacillus sp. DTU_2020_1000418_1_SI_GHA_SEK_038]|uniref:YppE family protein n=1 Tax=Bacillus sp. DTU_2020_1000418_1_SI_GHA_SEK_038 TaxID=3077585 RepID=UPI0028ECF19C|nr:YppE family protein [Bacillus sp. DTU_2020_1000418_1_SI_GHA_SEK_038]WNS73993.1 YppE family protein [Bacillus sp. DTU_2020_1000418_1_SI_GHA_SEK_038]
MNENVELSNLSNQLLNYIFFLSERYDKARELQKSGDFYKEVKPFADEVKITNDEWKKKAVQWIKLNRPKNLFVQQIESTYENIEAISVQAFYPETSKSRFTNLIVSSQYVLDRLLQTVKEEMGPPAT